MLPHKARLWAIVILTVLDLAALIAAHYLAPELIEEVRPLVETGLGAVLLVLAPALADALAVERRRRDPSVPALSDDVRGPGTRRTRSRSDDDDQTPPSMPRLGLGVSALMALVVAVGCGPSAVQVHARAATAAARVVAAGGDVVDQARSDALDRVEAQYPTDPEHDAQLDLEAARWQPVGAALDGVREALRAWQRSIELAHLADTGEVAALDLLPLAARVVGLYATAVRLAGSLGEELPALPDYVTALVTSLGGE